MPQPPPSISPRVQTTALRSAPFPFPPKLHTTRLKEAAKDQMIFPESYKFDNVAGQTSGCGAIGARDPLASVNTNSPKVGSYNPAKSTNPKSIRPQASHAIPLPPPVPDVFAPLINDSGQGSRPKRARDPLASPTPSLLKKLRVKEERTPGENNERVHRAEEERWTQKWMKAFPTLTFHFDVGVDDGPGRAMKSRVLRMGAKVDQFFSHHVTHLVVRGGSTPTKPKPASNLRRGDLPLRESPKNPFLDGTGVTDLVEKAEAMQIKVWTVKKLGEMLSRLAPLATASNNSLSHLLEDERLHGTRERDLSAPRPDYYYFKPGSKYLLVEDATAKSRTIMVKEYHYHSGNIEWPVIFSSFLKPHSGMMNTAVPVDKLRERAWALYVDREEYDGEQPPADQIKRSTSLRSLPETARLPTLQPYENASGNSVVLTSNIASTSAANGTPNGQPMGPSLGMTKDRALMQMSKRVQVLKGNARLAAMSRKKEQENSDPLRSGGLARRASTGTVGGKLEGLSTKTFVPQDQLIRMLRLARDPCADEVTYEERVKNREKVDLGLKGRDQDTASGYCENCRLRYQDLSVHIASKKHRRFAENDDNFEGLDNLLATLQRPPRQICQGLYPPCTTNHEQDADCRICHPTFDPDSPVDWLDDDGMYNPEGEGSGSEVDDEGCDGHEVVAEEDDCDPESQNQHADVNVDEDDEDDEDGHGHGDGVGDCLTTYDEEQADGTYLTEELVRLTTGYHNSVQDEAQNGEGEEDWKEPGHSVVVKDGFVPLPSGHGRAESSQPESWRTDQLH